MDSVKDLLNMDDENSYVWKESDRFVNEWLPKLGYEIISSEIQQDCIGYRCIRKYIEYTIFVYAYGETKTAQLDGDYCARLTEIPFAQNSTVLVLYLYVEKITNDNGPYTYKVHGYSGKDSSMDLWRAVTVQGRNILEYYPRKEARDMVYRFIAAYNKQSVNIIETILHSDASIKLKENEQCYIKAELTHLMHLFKNYGKMKLAYLRKNDVVFSCVPYLEGYGYIGFSVSHINDKITKIEEYPFDGKYEELWVTDNVIGDCPIDEIPKIQKIVFLEPEATQRFTVKVYFENGEVKKYVMPIKKEFETDEVILYKSHSFTDKIWNNGRISDARNLSYSISDPTLDYNEQGIDFINGFSIGTAQLYHDGTAFYEPIIRNEAVFENENIKVTKIAEWEQCSLWFAGLDLDSDDIIDKIKVLLPGGSAFNWKNSNSTFADTDGTRVTNIDFDYMGSFKDGVIKVGVNGFGYGFINYDMSFAVAPKYKSAQNFSEGHTAAVTYDDNKIIIDKTGREIPLYIDFSGKKYKKICECSDGMFKVSSIDGDSIFENVDFKLAYFHDYFGKAGIWGYVDTSGHEVIPPQYIFADDFEDGIALVCKGKWEYKDQWDERENTWGWWSEEMMWGFIDKQGIEIIPCIFDEINFFVDYENDNIRGVRYLKAHFGGWEKEGNWGIIDRAGNWIVQPIFKNIYYTIYNNDCFAFYDDDECSADDTPMGVYSITEKRILFSPQFLDVDFMDDGNFIVEVYDENLGRNIKKIINREGNQLFESEYSSIYLRNGLYEVEIWEDIGGKKRFRNGLIDETGKVILPCKYEADFNKISYEKKRIVCKNESSGKYGMIDFEENIIIPAVYDELHWDYKTEFLIAKIDKNGKKYEGLLLQNGTEVLPIIFERINIRENTIITYNEKSSSVYNILRNYENAN